MDDLVLAVCTPVSISLFDVPSIMLEVPLFEPRFSYSRDSLLCIALLALQHKARMLAYTQVQNEMVDFSWSKSAKEGNQFIVLFRNGKAQTFGFRAKEGELVPGPVSQDPVKLSAGTVVLTAQ